jgi:hypothetical protein
MHANEIWIALFRRIPSELHDALGLGISTGAEIVPQRIIKLDSEYMVLRGRMAGSTDPGRIMMVPYAQLTHITFTREMSEPEVEAIFGKGDVAQAGTTPKVEAAAAQAPEAAVVADSQPAFKPKKQDAPSKTVLLAKLRDRLKDSTVKK